MRNRLKWGGGVGLKPEQLARTRFDLFWVHVTMIVPFCLLAYLIISNMHLQESQLLYAYCVVFLLVSVWLLFSWSRRSENAFDLYMVFILSAILFNGSQIIFEVFGLNPNGILNGQFTDALLIKAVLLVTLSLLSVHAGALAGRGASRNRQPLQPSFADARSQTRALRLAAFLLLAVSLLPAVNGLKSGISLVISGGYLGYVQREAQFGVAHTSSLLADFLMPAALLLLAAGRKNRILLLMSVSVTMLYVLGQFFLGNRGGGAMALLAFLWLWNRCVRPLPKVFLVTVSTFMVLVAFPLIGIARSFSGADRYALGTLVMSYQSIQNPFIAAFSEMGTSLNTVVHTLNFVPSVTDFQWGSSYGYALLTVIPNLFWDIHPSRAHGSPSYWLVQLADPGWAAQGGGMGYSFIAEAYFNYSWLGAVVFLLFFGIALGRLIRWAEGRGELPRLVMIASFMVNFPQFARGDADLVVRTLVWYSFLPYLLVSTLQYIRFLDRPSFHARFNMTKEERS